MIEVIILIKEIKRIERGTVTGRMPGDSASSK